MEKEKLEKAKLKLQNLLDQKEKLDSNIKKVNKEIEDLEKLINLKAFDEASIILNQKGISLNEMLELIKSGNVNQLVDTLGKNGISE